MTCSSVTGTPTYQAWSANVTDSDSAMQFVSESCSGCADSASNTPLHGFDFSGVVTEAVHANCSPVSSHTHAREGGIDEQQRHPGEDRPGEHGASTEENDPHAD